MAALGIIGASGIDTSSLISALVSASSEPVTLLSQKARDARSASSQLSSLGSTLAGLRSSAGALDTATEVASFVVTQANTNAFTTVADGSAQPGAYNISVSQLAKEQRTYSKAFSVAKADVALGLTGSFTLAIGAGTAKEITLAATDSLETVSSRINGLGLRLQAGIFQEADGKFRMQLRGLDTGTANSVTFGVSGTSAAGSTLTDPLGIAETGLTASAGKTVQSATNSIMLIDGFSVERTTNQVSGAVAGLSFSLKDVTNSTGTHVPVNVAVAPDTGALVGKVTAFVSAFNGVVGSVNKLAGVGGVKAAVPLLSGDSTLRSILSELRSVATAGTAGTAGGLYASMREVGVTITKDGTLAVDGDKLSKAVIADPVSVQKLFARPTSATTGGIMATVREAVDGITNFTTGKLTSRKKYFDDKAVKADAEAAKKRTGLDAYAGRLRKQFTAMDEAYAKNASLGQQLSRMG